MYECDVWGGLFPEIKDFNNDNLNDITFISATAARSANEVRRLFIYDKQKDELISIVNSQEFPNINYNDELDCIDAWRIYGGNSTDFAKIKNDSLIIFASVSNTNYRIISEYDEFGNQTILSKDTIIFYEFSRYKNYKPLKEY